MVSITSSRVKKALLHPKAALLYLQNYLKGEIIRQKCKHHFLPGVNLKRVLGKKIYSNLEDYFLQRKEPHFFTEDDEFLEEIANQDFIIPTANRIFRQEFGFLGVNPKKIKNIDWNEDIKSGRHWPYSFYLDLREQLGKEYNHGRDIKLVWELSRFHYLMPLALAYYKTGERLYLEKWQELISDWIKRNPLYYGPNWINAMEAAIRTCNWIFSFEIIKKRLLRFARNDESARSPHFVMTRERCHPGTSPFPFLSSWKERAERATDRILWRFYRFPSFRSRMTNDEGYRSLQNDRKKRIAHDDNQASLRRVNEAGNGNQTSLRGANEASDEAISKDFLEKFLVSLIEHGRFIYSNLEYAPLPSNHYLSDLTGLFFLGMMFPEVKEARKWLSYSRKSLEREMERQVYNDGVDYELSISYHRYVLELFLWIDWLAKINGMNFSSSFERKLRKMTEFSWSYIKPNGLAPQIGDSDDSRLFLIWEDFYHWEKRDHFALFKLYEKVKGEKWNEPERISQAFPESGYYVIRDKDFYLITGRNKCCRGKGGSHIHNDILSFELNINKEDVIVDPGTFTYTSDLKMRNLFRSTAFHNTVVIDNKEQNPLSSDPFFIQQYAQLSVKKWKVSERKVIWEGEHNGYKRLKYPVIHNRRFELQRKEKILTIIDSFQGEGQHQLEWNFHLAPNIKVWVKETIKEEGKREIILMGRNTTLMFLAPKVLNCAIIKGVVSPSYGVAVPARIIRFSGFLKEDSQKIFEFQIKYPQDKK